MKKLAVLLICAITSPLWADKPLLVEINDFTGGSDTQHLPDKIALNVLRDCLNLRSDKKFGLSRRQGNKFALGCMNTSTLGLWDFIAVTGEEWLIRLDCRGSLIAAKRVLSDGSCFSVCISSKFRVSTIEPTDADTGLGRIWFTNKQNGLMSWDGSILYLHPAAPKAARVAIFKNRVVLADVSNEQSSIRMSGELNGDDWNDDSRFSTSPVSIRVGGVNDGDRVVDFFSGLGEGDIYKPHSLYRLLGNDQRDFKVENVSPEIGTIYPNTIAQRGVATIFLSNRGLDSYIPPYGFQTQITFQKIGEPLDNMFQPLASAKNITRTAIIDAQNDWEQGVSSPTGNISTSLSPGSLRPANQTFVDTNGSDWAKGRVITGGQSLLSTSTIPGSLVFSSTPQPFTPNESFENVDSDINLLNFTVSGSVGSNDTCNNTGKFTQSGTGGAYDGTYYAKMQTCWSRASGLGAAGVANVYIIDENNSVLVSTPVNLGAGANFTVNTFNFPALQGKKVKISISGRVNGPTSSEFAASTITTSQFVWVSTSLFFVARSSANQPTAGPRYTSDIDLDFLHLIPRPASDFVANYNSQSFDLQTSSPNFDPLRYTMSVGTITVGIRTSTDPACCFGADTATSSNSITTALRKRYVVYSATFSVAAATTPTNIVLNDLTLGSWATGYWTSGIVDVGADASTQRIFSAKQTLNDGGLTYQIQSVTGTNLFRDDNFSAQALDNQIVVSTAQYVKVRVYFNTNASTAIPIIENISLNYDVVKDFPTPFSVTQGEDYYIFYSSIAVSGQKNERIAVFNRNNAFDQLAGSSVSAAAVYSNTVMLGDAAPTGDVFFLGTSTTGADPNAKNVDSYFMIKRIDGGEPDAIKTFDRIYLTLSRVDVSSSQIFSVSYSLDGSTSSYNCSNIEISTGNFMVTDKSYLALDLPREGRYIDIKVAELTKNTQPYFIHRMKIYGIIKEVE